MGKRKKLIAVDFHTGIKVIVPSKQEAYSSGKSSLKVESQSVKAFKVALVEDIEARIRSNNEFPTAKELYVFIVQWFVSRDEYESRDIDNLAKTVLDSLKGIIYSDDGLVRTLVVCKKMDTKRIPENFAYIAIKALNSNESLEVEKIAGLERSVTFFNELKTAI